MSDPTKDVLEALGLRPWGRVTFEGALEQIRHSAANARATYDELQLEQKRSKGLEEALATTRRVLDERMEWSAKLSTKAGCWTHGDKPDPYCAHCGKVGTVIDRAEKAEALNKELLAKIETYNVTDAFRRRADDRVPILEGRLGASNAISAQHEARAARFLTGLSTAQEHITMLRCCLADSISFVTAHGSTVGPVDKAWLERREFVLLATSANIEPQDKEGRRVLCTRHTSSGGPYAARQCGMCHGDEPRSGFQAVRREPPCAMPGCVHAADQWCPEHRMQKTQWISPGEFERRMASGVDIDAVFHEMERRVREVMPQSQERRAVLDAIVQLIGIWRKTGSVKDPVPRMANVSDQVQSALALVWSRATEAIKECKRAGHAFDEADLDRAMGRPPATPHDASDGLRPMQFVKSDVMAKEIRDEGEPSSREDAARISAKRIAEIIELAKLVGDSIRTMVPST